MKKVVKFGGSSLASARQFKKVADIIKSDKSRRYVVPSAPGRRSDKDEKVTDLLYACYDAVAEGRSYKKILEKIKSRYMDIIDGLDLNLNLDHEFDRIEENFLAKAGRDYAASRGEYLNGIVAANFLGFEFVDAAEVIFFDENGNMVTGWHLADGKWFYLNPVSDGTRGRMVTGWQLIDDKWYYFNPVSDGTKGVLTTVSE